MTEQEIKRRAKNFATKWLTHRGYEKGETASFWRSLLHEVFNVENIDDFIEFERKVACGFIDGYIPSTQVLIEQKGKNIDLTKTYTQSDGSNVTPFQQAKRYADVLPNKKRPRWIVVCNFEEFRIYDLDLEYPEKNVQIVKLKDLGSEYYRLMFLVDIEQENIKKQNALSFKAGEIVGKLYDKLIEQYEDPNNPETLKSLNKLCVRLVFCLYAEDAGLFASHDHFHKYFGLANTPAQRRQALIDLFDVLNKKQADRRRYMDEILSTFPYVNGGLFADEHIEIPLITDEIAELILTEGSENFNWANISPTIFGSLFESTLNPVTRREGGMHYTSLENIHKVIDPLFLTDLKKELAEIKKLTHRIKLQKLVEFQNKLASLKFLDPACGSGNFLTETYLCLRRLENEVILLLSQGQQFFSEVSFSPIRVSISQFYGIEINDFAVSVAQTALWIAESQMRQETEEIIKLTDDFLPLKSLNHIVEGNALRIDWNDVVPSSELSYIMGNPPFVGTKYQSKEHKSDVLFVNPRLKPTDYVACWFYKAALLCQNSNIRVALVATNSITQGEQVEPIWGLLLNEVGISIDFAYRTFRWDSEATTKAHVHCVIIGFSSNRGTAKKVIFNADGTTDFATNINPYLIDGANTLIPSRTNPISNVPKMVYGSKPTDGGYLLLTEEEKGTLERKYPQLSCYIKRYMGALDMLHDTKRYCLWLKHCTDKKIMGGVFQRYLNA